MRFYKRAFDTKCPNRSYDQKCKLTIDDVYITVAQRIDTSKITDDVIHEVFHEVTYAIMNYINRPYVPCGLKYVVTSIMIDALHYYEQLAVDTTDPDYEPEIDAGAVTEVKVGDTNVKLGATTATGSDTTTARGRALNSHIPNLDSFLFDYFSQLNQYRSPITWRH